MNYMSSIIQSFNIARPSFITVCKLAGLLSATRFKAFVSSQFVASRERAYLNFVRSLSFHSARLNARFDTRWWRSITTSRTRESRRISLAVRDGSSLSTYWTERDDVSRAFVRPLLRRSVLIRDQTTFPAMIRFFLIFFLFSFCNFFLSKIRRYDGAPRPNPNWIDRG